MSNTTTIKFDKKSLTRGLSGGALITSAVVAMNNGAPMPISMGLFTSGWYLIYKSFSENITRESTRNKIMSLSAIIVWMSAMVLRLMMDNNISGIPMIIGGMAFMSGWLAIGTTSGIKSNEMTNSGMGLIVPMLIFASMASINGIERPRSIPSGPGIAMFTSAWVALSLVNSSTS